MNAIWPGVAHLRADVVLAVGLILATLVTIHVLLRKREVASAIGWIGLAWFAPIIGTVLYLVLGVNRVQRRARRLRAGYLKPAAGHNQTASIDHHLDALERGLRRLTDRSLVAGNAVRILQNGDAAYPAMLEAIGSAARSIGLTSYIFHDDVWGGRFVDALAAAHARGVAVRVLIDGVGGGWWRSAAWRQLRRRGVPAARFLHSALPWRMPFLNLRSHRKVLVLDGAVGFTGGLNIGDENVRETHPKNRVQDTHFRVEGPVVTQLVEAFCQDWAFASDDSEELGGDAWFAAVPLRTGGVPARVVDSGPDEDIEKIEFAMLQAVSCARESVAVMTPYFLPDDRMVTALSLAAMRGVAVDVVVPERSDQRKIDFAMGANVGPLLSNGVRIWRCPPPFRHSKLMTVDDAWCLVGSCNWDIRSFRLNFELCMECYDAELARGLSAFMVACRGEAMTGRDLARRNLAVRLRDAAVRLALPYL